MIRTHAKQTVGSDALTRYATVQESLDAFERTLNAYCELSYGCALQTQQHMPYEFHLYRAILRPEASHADHT